MEDRKRIIALSDADAIDQVEELRKASSADRDVGPLRISVRSSSGDVSSPLPFLNGDEISFSDDVGEFCSVNLRDGLVTIEFLRSSEGDEIEGTVGEISTGQKFAFSDQADGPKRQSSFEDEIQAFRDNAVRDASQLRREMENSSLDGLEKQYSVVDSGVGLTIERIDPEQVIEDEYLKLDLKSDRETSSDALKQFWEMTDKKLRVGDVSSIEIENAIRSTNRESLFVDEVEAKEVNAVLCPHAAIPATCETCKRRRS